MKLVDWDKVKISYDKQVSGTIIEPIYNIKVEASVVEAIPKEWIINWLTKQTIPALHTCDEYEAVSMMLDDWEKENEIN